MKRGHNWLWLLLPLLLMACQTTGTAPEVETALYQNPIGEMTDIGDPFVIKEEDTYYMYATSEPGFGYRVWTSENLQDWQDAGIAYDHRDHEEKWAYRDFWAPEVVAYQDEFIMTYSARAFNGSLRISLAKSDSPLGPFEDYAVDIIPDAGSYIDGHIFFDDDGTPYLYYVKDNYENFIDGKQVSQILVQEMNEDLTAVLGEPVIIATPDHAWEGVGGDFQWNEGPFVMKDNETYYMMYSANFFASSDYAVGYATADNPLGPFTKSEDNPILSSDLSIGISGPGHNSVVAGLDDETLYTVYHIHTYPDMPSGDRRPAIDRIYFEDGKLVIDGPTMDEQELR